jgi:hypothetical protein
MVQSCSSRVHRRPGMRPSGHWPAHGHQTHATSFALPIPQKERCNPTTHRAAATHRNSGICPLFTHLQNLHSMLHSNNTDMCTHCTVYACIRIHESTWALPFQLDKRKSEAAGAAQGERRRSLALACLADAGRVVAVGRPRHAVSWKLQREDCSAMCARDGAGAVTQDAG